MRTRAGSLGIRRFGITVFVTACLLSIAVGVDAQLPITVLHDFNGHTEPWAPVGVMQGSDGNFYGVTEHGGTSNHGSIYRMTSDGTIAVLYSFPGGEGGAYPLATLLEANDGNFYGTTHEGGESNNGTIFRMTPDGTVTILHRFTNGPTSAGRSPASRLIQGSDGNIYGATTQGPGIYGGYGGSGTVFRMTPIGDVAVIGTFSRSPTGIIQASDGNFYVSISIGDTAELEPKGKIVRMTPAGSSTVLHTFVDNSEGHTPSALTEAADGNLYGTTRGFNSNGGTIFRITTSGSFTVLHSFPSGSEPLSGVVKGSDGNLYGTSSGGDSEGTFYKMSIGGVFETIYSFGAGDMPDTRPVQAGDRSFYGTTRSGGSARFGTVYRVASTGVIEELHAFTAGPGGARPIAPLLEASGNFYGTTERGGSSDLGTIYRLTPSGSVEILHEFAGATDGARPRGALLQAADGYFYGTTSTGGTFDGGTIFRMAANGAISIIHNFTSGFPSAALMQASDGNFYGAAGSRIFKMTPDGTVAILHELTRAEGAELMAPLVEGPDGNLFGIAFQGGNYDTGSLFRIDPQGTLVRLHSFGGYVQGKQLPAYPTSLIRASDGNLYVATTCGSDNGGAIFRATVDGTVANMASLTSTCGNRGSPPTRVITLTQGRDGTLYGTDATPFSSSFDSGFTGLLFRMTLAGEISTLHWFGSPLQGLYPLAPFIQASDGRFYGTASSGGLADAGTLLSLNPNDSCYLQLNPRSAVYGAGRRDGDD